MWTKRVRRLRLANNRLRDRVAALEQDREALRDLVESTSDLMARLRRDGLYGVPVVELSSQDPLPAGAVSIDPLDELNRQLMMLDWEIQREKGEQQ